jgi:hypothetical protein
MDRGCRLTVEGGLAMLDGSPTELRRLAEALEAAPDEFTFPMATGSLTQLRTDDALLRVGVVDDSLTVEGNEHALGILYNSLTSLADIAESAEDRTIRRHVHIEYLGESDQWRSPDSYPLVVGADWPSE